MHLPASLRTCRPRVRRLFYRTMLSSSKRLYESFLTARREGRLAQLESDEPVAPRAPREKRRGYIRDYWIIVRPFMRPIIWVFALAIVAACTSLVLPLATRHAVDKILMVDRDRVALMKFGWAMLVLILFQQVIYMTRQWRMAVLNAQLLTRLRRRLFLH